MKKNKEIETYRRTNEAIGGVETLGYLLCDRHRSDSEAVSGGILDFPEPRLEAEKITRRERIGDPLGLLEGGHSRRDVQSRHCSIDIKLGASKTQRAPARKIK